MRMFTLPHMGGPSFTEGFRNDADGHISVSGSTPNSAGSTGPRIEVGPSWLSVPVSHRSTS